MELGHLRGDNRLIVIFLRNEMFHRALIFIKAASQKTCDTCLAASGSSNPPTTILYSARKHYQSCQHVSRIFMPCRLLHGGGRQRTGSSRNHTSRCDCPAVTELSLRKPQLRRRYNDHLRLLCRRLGCRATAFQLCLRGLATL